MIEQSNRLHQAQMENVYKRQADKKQEEEIARNYYQGIGLTDAQKIERDRQINEAIEKEKAWHERKQKTIQKAKQELEQKERARLVQIIRQQQEQKARQEEKAKQEQEQKARQEEKTKQEQEKKIEQNRKNQEHTNTRFDPDNHTPDPPTGYLWSTASDSQTTICCVGCNIL